MKNLILGLIVIFILAAVSHLCAEAAVVGIDAFNAGGNLFFGNLTDPEEGWYIETVGGTPVAGVVDLEGMPIMRFYNSGIVVYHDGGGYLGPGDEVLFNGYVNNENAGLAFALVEPYTGGVVATYPADYNFLGPGEHIITGQKMQVPLDWVDPYGSPESYFYVGLLGDVGTYAQGRYGSLGGDVIPEPAAVLTMIFVGFGLCKKKLLSILNL